LQSEAGDDFERANTELDEESYYDEEVPAANETDESGDALYMPRGLSH